MIAVSALALGVFITASALVFGIVKAVGAAYLIWLDVSLWRSARTMKVAQISAHPARLGRAFKSEAMVALGNPKAILIFAAFFPKFVVLQSYAILGAAFLLMEAVAIFANALAGPFASKFASDRLPIMQRISGITMCIFGILLLVSPQPLRA